MSDTEGVTHRREILLGFNDSHYFSLVVQRTIYGLIERIRDRVFLCKSSLFYQPKNERTLIRETLFTYEGVRLVPKDKELPEFDLTAYLVQNSVHNALLLHKPADYIRVDETGIFVKESADAQQRVIVVPKRTVRRFLPGFGADTKVMEAYLESKFCFVLLQHGIAAANVDGVQKIFPFR